MIKYLFLLLAMAACGRPALAQAKEEARHAAIERKVVKALANNKAIKAEALCSPYLGAKPVVRFYPLRADARNRIGEHALAEGDARMGLASGSDRNACLLQLALAEIGQGRADSAVMRLEAITEPEDVSGAYRLAVAYQSAQRYGDAVRVADRVLGGGTSELVAKAHRLKGECAAILGDSATALQELGQAVGLEPRDPVHLNSMGYYGYALRDRHAEAIVWYTKAIKLNPNYSYAFNNRGWSHFRTGDHKSALADIRKARKRKPFNPYVYRNLGLIALAEGDTVRACTEFRTALDYGFTALHGNEVETLMKTHCASVRIPVQSPALPMDMPATPKPAVRSNAPGGGNAPK